MVHQHHTGINLHGRQGMYPEAKGYIIPYPSFPHDESQFKHQDTTNREISIT